MQFVFPSLAWGFLLVLVPVLIHLINMLRHRRQRWAAMDFLLESYRKHRKWILLKQWILLATRMLIMALLVAMLAHWVSGARLLQMLGQRVTHHYILLDDSLSMADEVSGVSAYQQGLEAIAGLLRSVAEDRGVHLVTVLRWSRATIGNSQSSVSPNSSERSPNGAQAWTADSVADILARTVPAEPTGLLERLMATRPLALELSPADAINSIRPLIQTSANENAIVYVFSDFRTKDWTKPENIKTALRQLASQTAEIHLVDCVTSHHQNLAIVDIQPDQEILAAGVPTFVKVSIQNFGTAPARNVQLRLNTVEYGGTTSMDRDPSLAHSGTVNELPNVLIDQIMPNEVVTRQTQVVFSRPGNQIVQAELPPDCLAGDNRAATVLHISEGQSVLLIDGSDDKRGSYFLESVLNPGASAKTGFLVNRQEVSFLRDCSPGELSKYAVVVLVHVGRIDPRAIEHLQGFVRQGGGLAFLPGASMNAADYRAWTEEWYQEGRGLLPVRLQEPATLVRSEQDGAVDLIAESHPIVQPLLGLGRSPFQLVRISKYFPVDQDLGRQRSTGRSAARTIVRLRNNEPLMMEAPYGDGRVVVLLTGLDAASTNWPQDPTFVVVTLKMVGFLGSFRREETNQRVGTPILTKMPAREFAPDYSVLLPKSLGTPRTQIDGVAADDGEGNWVVRFQPQDHVQNEDLFRAVTQPGIVEVWGMKLQGDPVAFNVAQNVSPAEGNLAKVESTELISFLRPVEVRYRSAVALQSLGLSDSLTNRSFALLVILFLLLLFEQMMAWSASYHLPQIAKRGGG